MEGLEVHTMWVITEGSKHPSELERPFTSLRKKMMVRMSGMPDENLNHATQGRTKAIPKKGFKLILGGTMIQVMKKITI